MGKNKESSGKCSWSSEDEVITIEEKENAASLVAGYREYCSEAEQLAVSTVALPDAPLFSCFASLSRLDFLVILKVYRERMSVQEQAVTLSAITDFVSCSFNEASHLRTFEKKHDQDMFNKLLQTLNIHWAQLLNTMALARNDITIKQMQSFVSLLHSSVNRLRSFGRHFYFQEAVTIADKVVSRRMRAEETQSMLKKTWPAVLETPTVARKSSSVKTLTGGRVATNSPSITTLKGAAAPKASPRITTPTATVSIAPKPAYTVAPKRSTLTSKHCNNAQKYEIPVISLDTTPVKCKPNAKENVPEAKKKPMNTLAKWIIDLTKINPDLTVSAVDPKNVLKGRQVFQDKSNAAVTPNTRDAMLGVQVTNTCLPSAISIVSCEPPTKKLKEDSVTPTNAFDFMMKRSRAAYSNRMQNSSVF